MITHDTVVTWLFIMVLSIVATAIIVVTAHRDKTIPIRYDCALLVGGWHPDFPPEVIEACRRKGIKYDNSKTSY